MEWGACVQRFSLSTCSTEPPPWSQATPGEWTDQEDRLTADWLQHQGINVSVEIAGPAVQTVAKEQSFHPVRQHLDEVKWGGTKRIDGWLSLYVGVTPQRFYDRYRRALVDFRRRPHLRAGREGGLRFDS